jgi:hypothetical protein
LEYIVEPEVASTPCLDDDLYTTSNSVTFEPDKYIQAALNTVKIYKANGDEIPLSEIDTITTSSYYTGIVGDTFQNCNYIRTLSPEYNL